MRWLGGIGGSKCGGGWYDPYGTTEHTYIEQARQTVLAGAKESGVALEINADPSRLDLDEVYARRAAEMGIVLSIDTDAHSTEMLDHMEYGVSVARRAWVGPESVINAWPAEKLVGWLKKRG